MDEILRSTEAYICHLQMRLYLDLIYRDNEPDMCVRGFIFIFEMNAGNMTTSVSILRVNLTFLMPVYPGGEVRVEPIVQVSNNSYRVVIT